MTEATRWALLANEAYALYRELLRRSNNERLEPAYCQRCFDLIPRAMTRGDRRHAQFMKIMGSQEGK